MSNSQEQVQPVEKKLSVASVKWDVEGKGFLTEEQKQLRALDKEGTGSLSAKQLAVFAEQHKALRNENKQIKRGLIGLALLTVLFFIGTVTASVLAAQANNDTNVNSATGAMLAKDTGTPVATNTNEAVLPLAALAFLPDDFVSHVSRLTLSSADNMLTYHRNVAAIDIGNQASVTVTTTLGDKIIWDAETNPESITVTLNDGTTWEKPAECESCAATSAVLTDDIKEGVDSFMDYFGLECSAAYMKSDDGRRLLTCVCNTGEQGPPGGGSF